MSAYFMSTYVKFSNPVTIVLLIVLALVLVRRRLYRELPWFTVYVVYVAAYTAVFFWVDSFRNAQIAGFFVYWGGNVINQFIAFLVIIEVFRNCVSGHDSVRKAGVTLLAVIAFLAFVVALSLAPFGSQFDQKVVLNQLSHAVMVLQRSIRVIQICLLIGIFGFSSYLGLTWRNYNFGIALGYGLYASVNLVTAVAWEYLGARKMFDGLRYVTVVDGLAYKLTIILWITYLWRADRGRSSQLPPSTGSAELEEYTEVLKPLIKQ